MITTIRSWLRDRRARKVVRQAVAGMKVLKVELADELERDPGNWRCYSWSWIGETPVAASESWGLENIRGFSSLSLHWMCVHSRNCTDTYAASMRFLDTKSQTLNLRVSPSFEQALKIAADHKQCSVVNMLEAPLRDYLDPKSVHSELTGVPHPPKRAKSRSMAAAQVEVAA